MRVVLWIIAGALTAWVASFVLKNGSHKGPFLHIDAGVIGAVVGGYVLTHYLEQLAMLTLSVYGVVGAIFAASMLIGLVWSFRR